MKVFSLLLVCTDVTEKNFGKYTTSKLATSQEASKDLKFYDGRIIHKLEVSYQW